jgi:hypothetical protein
VSGTELRALRDLLGAAVASLDSEQIDQATAELSALCARLNAGTPSKQDRAALLEWCSEIATVVNSAADFYLRLASLMQVQLYGYGSSRFAPSEWLGAKFSAKA